MLINGLLPALPPLTPPSPAVEQGLPAQSVLQPSPGENENADGRIADGQESTEGATRVLIGRQSPQPDEAETPEGREPIRRGVPDQTTGVDELTPEEKREVEELKARDREVRAHERAHLAAAGTLARGGADLQYVTGPDGNRYAVAGEVSIDTGDVPNDPEATIRKAQQIRRAALAPADPSTQDRRVAAEAAQMEFEARMEVQRERTREAEERYAEQQSNYTGSIVPPQTNPVDMFA